MAVVCFLPGKMLISSDLQDSTWTPHRPHWRPSWQRSSSVHPLNSTPALLVRSFLTLVFMPLRGWWHSPHPPSIQHQQMFLHRSQHIWNTSHDEWKKIILNLILAKLSYCISQETHSYFKILWSPWRTMRSQHRSLHTTLGNHGQPTVLASHH